MSPASWIDWLSTTALPLWSERGFDAETDSFVERLGLDGVPQHDVPRRLMVQARQVFVFATAARNGWFPGAGELALRAGDAMIRRYHGAGRAPGWAFSCARDGTCFDARRDLYAHAFVLLALASMIGLDPQQRTIALVHETMAFLDRTLAHPAGGYAEQWPAAALPRRQNPHMHLLEAFLALQEVKACCDFSSRIAKMIALFDEHFFSTDDDVLSEYFDSQWTPANAARAFEPGHHFEWIWLLTRHAAITGAPMDGRIRRLLESGLQGMDARGRIVDAMGASSPVSANCRLWPAMEAAKALNTRQGRAAVPGGTTMILAAAWQAFVVDAIPGGWIDRVDPSSAPLVDYMPASSLYHICTALDDLR